jgi:hypothetical protein
LIVEAKRQSAILLEDDLLQERSAAVFDRERQRPGTDLDV